MATTVTLAQGAASRIVAGQPINFVATVSNTGSSAITLTALQVTEQTDTGCQISQPNFQTPNVAPGTGNPSIAASSSASYSFQIIFTAPYGAGPSPQNAPGGAAPGPNPANPNVTLLVVGQSSDGVFSSTPLMVPVLSAIAPFPRPEGGALQFSQGSNLINGIIMGVL